MSYLTNISRRKGQRVQKPQKPTVGAPLALLIGVNYRGQSAELRGCVNDTLDMRSYLLSMGYLDSNIVMMNEYNNNKSFLPTKANIQTVLRDTLARAKTTNAREVLIHYSGHGSYIRDTNGDEVDKRDEVIVPLDYLSAGFLSDDVLNSILVQARLPSSTKVYGLFDSCFSGSILDLRFRFISGKTPAIENNFTGYTNEIYCISGCRDDQTSAETYLNGKISGVMTTNFLALVKNKSAVPLSSLITDLNKALKGDQSQVPQLSSSTQITSNSRFISRV